MRVLRNVNPQGSASAKDDGAIAVVVALLAVVMVIFAAFAVDIGNAYAQARQLSVAADADALAAAAAVGNEMPLGVPCTQAQLDTLTDGDGNVGAEAIAKATADALNTANSKSGAPEPVESVTVACAPASETDTGTNAIEVRVNTRRAISTSLAGIIGINEISPNSYAVARYIRVQTAGGLRPWAVCNATISAAQSAKTTTFWTGIDGISGPCDTSASGNWGAVDFDGGNNSAVDLAEWTLNGYPGPVIFNPDPPPYTLIPADPGVSNSNALRDAFKKLIGQISLFPSVKGFTPESAKKPGGGSNASFQIEGIATVEVCGIVYGNNVYNTYPVGDDAGQTSSCWVPPVEPSTSTSTTDVPVVEATRTVGPMPKNSKDLKTSDDFFPLDSVDPLVTHTVEVTIAGAGPGGKDLTTGVVTPITSVNQVTLTSKVSDDIVSGSDVSVKVTTSTTTTTVGTAGAPLPQPGPYEVQGNKLRLLDHIQFRWVDFTTSSYQGSDAEPCEFTDGRCVGATLLWQ